MIRLGRQEEIEGIIALTKSCGKHMRENGIDQWDEKYPDYDSIVNDLKTNTLWVYAENEVILGIVVLNESADEEYNEIKWLSGTDSRNLIVHRLAVLPSCQGKGIARKLMDFAESYAETEGYDSIRLDTFSQNPRNQKFYSNREYNKLGSVFLKYRDDYPYYCYELLLNGSTPNE